MSLVYAFVRYINFNQETLKPFNNTYIEGIVAGLT